MFVRGRNQIWLFNISGAYQLLEVYQTIWQSLEKNWEMLGLELQLNLVRPINPKGQKILFNHSQ